MSLSGGVPHVGAKAALTASTHPNSSPLPSALSKVIMALQAKASHVPFRDSKLTYLLQHSLGGGARTLLVANVNPLHAHASETLCTLRFATAVANVR